MVAFSPLSIIPAVLVLHTPRPRPTACVHGRLADRACGVTAIFLEVSNLLGASEAIRRVGRHGCASASRRPIVFGVYRLVDPQALRAHAGLDAEPEQALAARAAAAAAALTVVNPKVLFICAAAGLAIGSEGLGSTRAWVAVVWYVAAGPGRRSRYRSWPTRCPATASTDRWTTQGLDGAPTCRPGGRHPGPVMVFW